MSYDDDDLSFRRNIQERVTILEQKYGSSRVAVLDTKIRFK